MNREVIVNPMRLPRCAPAQPYQAAIGSSARVRPINASRRPARSAAASSASTSEASVPDEGMLAIDAVSLTSGPKEEAEP